MDVLYVLECGMLLLHLYVTEPYALFFEEDEDDESVCSTEEEAWMAATTNATEAPETQSGSARKTQDTAGPTATPASRPAETALA